MNVRLDLGSKRFVNKNSFGAIVKQKLAVENEEIPSQAENLKKVAKLCRGEIQTFVDRKSKSVDEN